MLHEILPRYIRLKRSDESLEEISNFLGVSSDNLYRVHWLPQFVCIPGKLKISHAKPIEHGFFPMDIASAVAVISLDLPKSNANSLNVLDLCCCPGGKYQMLSDICRSLNFSSNIVGVDISENRMSLCKSLVRKWNENDWMNALQMTASKTMTISDSNRQLLFLADGTIFDRHNMGKLIYDSSYYVQKVNGRGSNYNSDKKSIRIVSNKSSRAREQQYLRDCQRKLSDPSLCDIRLNEFDYVLVDAECSHDGSYRHMNFIDGVTLADFNEQSPFKKSRGEEIGQNMTSSSNVPRLKSQAYKHFEDPDLNDKLENLQRKLLSNGFQKLKVGGELVYSTCSFQQRQNEDIVSWFLRQEQKAELVAINPNMFHTDDSHDLDNITTQSESIDHSMTAIIHKILCGDDEELRQFLITYSSWSSAEQDELCKAMCRYIANSKAITLTESEILPGTLKLSRKTGMSGLFISKIRRII
jgi:16S rRNA C967 or C1407 C5-methylase (RsmB/RsmF family)